VEATDLVNRRTKKRMLEKIIRAIDPPAGKTVALLGLAFKANTDDLRESPALPLIEGLLAAGARIRVHDPKALSAAEAIFGSKIKYFEDEYAAAEGAEALVLVTEWEQYRNLNLPLLKEKMAQAMIIDLRNLLTPENVHAHGFLYEGIGRGQQRTGEKNGQLSTL